MKNEIIYKDKLQELEDKLFELDEKWNESRGGKLNLGLAKDICKIQEEINDILTNKK